MNSRTFGVMVALALAAIIMLTVLLDFVTAHATPITDFRGKTTKSEAYRGILPSLMVGVYSDASMYYVDGGLQIDVDFGDFGLRHWVGTNREVQKSIIRSPLFSNYRIVDHMWLSLPDIGWNTANPFVLTLDEFAMVKTIDFKYMWNYLDYPGLKDSVTTGSVTHGSPVPEPTTALLFGAGLLGLTSIRRRKM